MEDFLEDILYFCQSIDWEDRVDVDQLNDSSRVEV